MNSPECNKSEEDPMAFNEWWKRKAFGFAIPVYALAYAKSGWQAAITHANSKHSDKMEDYDRLARLAEKQAEEIEREKLYSSMLFDQVNAANALIKELEAMVAMLVDVVQEAHNRITQRQFVGELVDNLEAALDHTQATAQAHEAEVKAKALEEAGEGWDTQVYHSAGTIRTALRRMAQDIRATSKKAG